MTKKLGIITIIFLIFIIFAVVCVYLVKSSLSPVGTFFDRGIVVEKVYVVINKGDNGTKVISELFQNRAIKSIWATKIFVKITGLDQRFKPGGYWLSVELDTPSILRQLANGPKDIWITIPEGWRREQIAARLQANLDNFSPGLFLDLTSTIEGRLFPDTYLIPASAAPADVVTLLTRNFSQKTGLDLTGSFDLTIDSRRLKLTGSQILILASLVEREAKNQSERENIAAILLKRLSLDWPLQVDASVQYARDTQKCSKTPLDCKYWEPVWDTHLVSAFNTYLHPGLPPGPIANPGLAVISAVRNPQDTPYLFYLTGTDGVTHYAQNLPQHQLNIDKYLKP